MPGGRMQRRALVLLMFGSVASGCSPGAGPITPQPTGPPPPTAQSSEHGKDADDGTPAPALGEASTVAAGFAQAWSRTSADPNAWWAGVAPWCEEGLADKLRSADPRNIPATTI